MMKKVMRIFIQFDFLARDIQTFNFIWKDLDLFFQKKLCVEDKRAYAQNKEWKVDKMAPPTIEWKLFLLFINSIKYGE